MFNTIYIVTVGGSPEMAFTDESRAYDQAVLWIEHTAEVCGLDDDTSGGMALEGSNQEIVQIWNDYWCDDDSMQVGVHKLEINGKMLP